MLSKNTYILMEVYAIKIIKGKIKNEKIRK